MKKIPIRSMLIALKGKVLLGFDFSQAESWVVAYLAESRTMKEALLRAGTKFDIHYTTSRGMYNYPDTIEPNKDERYMGKKFNHSCSYGTSPQMISHVINAEAIYPPYLSITLAQAKILHERWLALYPEIPRWWMEIQRKLDNDRTLVTPYRRKRTFYARWNNELFKEAYAYIPQSTVGDHCLGAVQPELGIEGGVTGIHKNIVSRHNDIAIVNTSHDSVIIECPSSNAKDIGEQVYKLLKRPLIVNGEQFTIPVDAEIGERWGELEKMEMAA